MFIEQTDYDEIKRTLPLNAVELLVFDSDNNVLMFKRTNEPAKDQWWIPGGRIRHAETRNDAAKRLLKDECGITDFDLHPFQTIEYAVKDNTNNYYQHIISTIYKVNTAGEEIKIDSQTSEFSWQPSSAWLKIIQDDFLSYLLKTTENKTPPSFLKDGISTNDKNGFIRNELYHIILHALSTPCADILVSNSKGEILLVKRKNEPEKNKWWVPGGRILFGEKRMDAAKRKLKEECGLNGEDFKEIWIFDYFHTFSNKKIIHNVSYVYEATVNGHHVVLDDQSLDYSWRSADEWLKEDIDGFIRNIILHSKLVSQK